MWLQYIPKHHTVYYVQLYTVDNVATVYTAIPQWHCIYVHLYTVDNVATVYTKTPHYIYVHLYTVDNVATVYTKTPHCILCTAIHSRQCGYSIYRNTTVTLYICTSVHSRQCDFSIYHLSVYTVVPALPCTQHCGCSYWVNHMILYVVVVVSSPSSRLPWSSGGDKQTLNTALHTYVI